MHTVVVMSAGAALLAACLLLGHAFGNGVEGAIQGAMAFILLWFICAGLNMWIGVSQAGYSVAEEAPIFAGIFGLLVLVSLLAIWYFSRR